MEKNRLESWVSEWRGKNTDLRDENWDLSREAECSLLKKQVCKSSAKGKLAARFPFWRERGKAANIVRCRQKWWRHFWVGVNALRSQVGKNPGWILETVQSNEIAGTKRNVLVYKGKKIQKLRKGKLAKRSSFLERKGDSWYHFVRIKESILMS